MPSGGPRTPSKPAPASGPGRLSKRTDGGPTQAMRDLPNAAYGEQAAMQEIQSGAGMAMAEGALSPGSAGGGMPPVEVTPFGAPTNRPDEPVTSGSPLGPGPGPESLGLSSEQDLQEQDKKTLVAYLPVLEYYANSPQGMPSLRAIVRKIKAANGL